MQLVPIQQLHPNSKNPRLIRDARFTQLVASLIDLPEMLELRPLVFDETNAVLGGNMRLKAVLHVQAWPEEDKLERIEHAVFHRGLKLNEDGDTIEEATEAQKDYYRAALNSLFFGETIPAVQALNLTEAQKKEFIVKDNASFGEWDWVEAAAQGWGKEIGDWGVETPFGWGDEPTELEQEEEGEFEEREITSPLQSAKKCPHCGEPI